MTRTSRACGLIIVYSLLAGLLACGIASAQDINSDFTEGVELFQQRTFRPAINKLESVVEAEPENEAAWYYLGVARFEEDQYEEALDALQQAYDLRPGRPGTQLYIGRIYEQLGAFEEAIRAYQTELRNRRFKNLAEVFTALGRAYYFSGRYYDAVETLTEALDHNENYVGAYFYRGLAEYMQEEYEAAVRDFDAGIEVMDEWDRLVRRLDKMAERAGEGGLSPQDRRARQEIQEELAQDYSRAAEFNQEAMWPALYVARGDASVEAGNYGIARNSYRKALDPNKGGNPADPLPQVKIGQAYFQQARETFYDEGLLWTAINTVDEAIYTIEDALEDSASNPVAHKTLGDIFLFQANTYVSDPDRGVVSSNFEDAEARYDAAIAAAPDYVEAYEGRAQTYIAMDQSDNAIDDLQTALDLAPRNADLYGALAMAHVLAEDYEEAASTAQVALNLDPENAEAHNAAGLAYYYQGELGGATEHFTKAIEADPTRHQSYTNLGNAYFQMRSWHRARANYMEALELIPKPAIANTSVQRSYLHYLVARTYHKAGMYQREVEALNEALALDASYFDALTQLAKAYQELEQYQAAEQALETALGVSPDVEQDAAIHVQLGRLYEEQGKPYEAITAYGAAVAAQSDNLEAREALKRLTSS